MRLNRINAGNIDALLDGKQPVTLAIEIDGVTRDEAREIGALWGKEVRIVGAQPELEFDGSPLARPTLPLDPREWELVVTEAFGAVVPPSGDGWFLVSVGAYGYGSTPDYPSEAGAVLTWARKRAKGESP